ncbi:MAG: GDSL-type esterase/lipase family protein [Lachnospiraceae bacterium]|uniref:GDSL-type esterase/lipase family protein n=1 Tax=Porcincola intestinalis TaxID=2606632 RepID=UPI002A915F81|nr:GDSL-type esterase/lipase family protein [Porcincola intestinalis]MCI6699194.1 GDSL-type esterase/lipase family protein [Lachnospiraceae bacterium]
MPSSQTTTKTSSTVRRRRKGNSGRTMIPRLLVLVFVFIAVFEGRIIHTLLTHRVSPSSSGVTATQGKTASDASQNQDKTASTPSAGAASTGSNPDQGLAGLATVSVSGTATAQADTAGTDTSQQTDASGSGETIDSAAVVPAQSDSVDDSYFSDAVFIGDSRMEGFRNASGITQGTFLTGVGLSINDMDKQIISTADGNISVYQGLSGRQYKRIYLMLGTNDLGFYPWDQFQPTFEKAIKQFHALQPDAVIYICSVIYVEESKIAKGFEYDNNQNVQTINQYILSTCEDLWYSYYLNLNEIFSDGNHELIPGASADGIHLEPEYCAQMLTYLKSHYISDSDWSQVFAANGGDSSASGAETEGAAVKTSSSASQTDESTAQSGVSAATSGSADTGNVSAG